MKNRFLFAFALVFVVPSLADSDMLRVNALKMLMSGQAGISEFNKWRDDQPNLALNLSRVSLKGLDLSRANLAEVNLAESDLSGSRLTRVYLYRADLRGANLTGVSFEEADFRGANYVYTTMNRELLDQIEAQNRRTVIISK